MAGTQYRSAEWRQQPARSQPAMSPPALFPYERSSRARALARRRRRRKINQAVLPWLFLSPALLLFTYFKFLPLAQGLRDSFYEVRPYLGDRYVGLANYADVMTNPQLTPAIWQTVELAVGTTAGSVALGFVLALLVEGQARHLRLVRAAAFLPMVTTMGVVAEVWRIMYYPGADGMINSMLCWFGLSPQPFLTSEHSALISLIVVGVWRGAPYDMMIFLAGLAAVDRNLYESAAVDGA
ncbi:MAG: sugar ABC transporter permease, partial [Micromonosporaceae bacterium]|nr:sugar ABC transporter permease [Micromonosporaceae bacterium]